MRDENKSVKSSIRKRSLVSAIIGAAIALFTIICCGLLVPLGLFTAAAFLHQWRIPLIVLGVVIAVISIFFLLKGKEIICFCKALDITRKHKKLIIYSLGIILCIGLISVFLSSNFFKRHSGVTETVTPGVTEIIVSEWKNSKPTFNLESEHQGMN